MLVKNERDERGGLESKEGGHAKETQAGFSAREAVGRDVDAVLWKADACNFSTFPLTPMPERRVCVITAMERR